MPLIGVCLASPPFGSFHGICGGTSKGAKLLDVPVGMVCFPVLDVRLGEGVRPGALAGLGVVSFFRGCLLKLVFRLVALTIMDLHARGCGMALYQGNWC